MNARTVPSRIFQNAIVSVGPEDRVTFHKTKTNLVAVNNLDDGYELRDEATNVTVFKTHKELYDALDSGVASIDYCYHNVQMARLRVLFGDKQLKDFSPKTQARALYIEKQIKLYDDLCKKLGKPPRRSKAKMEAWLAATRVRIIAEQIEEAAGGGRIFTFPVQSWKTFQRNYKKYHAANEEALALVLRHHGPGQRLFNNHPESIHFAVKCARRYLSRLRPYYSQVYRDYEAMLFKENKNGNNLHKVSRKKFLAIIGTFDEFEKVATRYGMKHAIRKFMKIKKTFDIQRPGQRIEIDHMKIDLITLLSEIGALDMLPKWARDAIEKADVAHKRIHIVAAIDVATRYILAFKATTNPKAASAVAALRMIMSNKQWISTYVGARTPWIGRLWPEEVYTDNGTEFIAGRTEQVFRAARVGYTRPAAGDPQRRPFIESFFHVIGPLLTQHFDGKTFINPSDKADYDPTAHVSIDVDEMVKVFLVALLDIYHNRPHSGLGGNTPHNAWVQATQEYEIKFSPSATDMIRIFGVAATRVIQTDGIVNYGITYNSDELQTLRRQQGQVEFEIMYDQECAETIVVKGPQGWFPVKNTIGLDHTITLYEWTAARKAIRDRNAENATEGMEIMYEAINRIRQIGEAATLRAGLSHVVPSDEDLEKLNAQVFGSWVASPVTVDHKLDSEIVVPRDPLRGGELARVAGGVGSDTEVITRLFEEFGGDKKQLEEKPTKSSFSRNANKFK
jgi:putative transposase